MIFEALLLGLSTGTYCTMYCAPVLVPFLAGTHKSSYKRNAALTGTFLVSRLAMYTILGAVSGALGLLVSTFFDPVLARRLSVFAYIFCSASLLANTFGTRFPWGTAQHGGCKCRKLSAAGNDWVTASLTGLATGLHLCPPLWTALVRSVFGGNGLPGACYLLFFYLGTLPFFIPLLGLPFLTKRIPAVKRIAQITQLLLGIYFLIFNGFIPLFF